MADLNLTQLKAARKLYRRVRGRRLRDPVTATELAVAPSTLQALVDRGYAYEADEDEETGARRYRLTGRGEQWLDDFEHGRRAAVQGRPQEEMLNEASQAGWGVGDQEVSA